MTTAALIRIDTRCAAILVLTVSLIGCSYSKRPAQTPEQLLKARTDTDAQAAADGRELIGRMLKRTKAQYDEYVAHRRATPPVVDILIISSGGDWGAFGA